MTPRPDARRRGHITTDRWTAAEWATVERMTAAERRAAVLGYRAACVCVGCGVREGACDEDGLCATCGADVIVGSVGDVEAVERDALRAAVERVRPVVEGIAVACDKAEVWADATDGVEWPIDYLRDALPDGTWTDKATALRALLADVPEVAP